jgi:hypothetical protein
MVDPVSITVPDLLETERFFDVTKDSPREYSWHSGPV